MHDVLSTFTLNKPTVVRCAPHGAWPVALPAGEFCFATDGVVFELAKDKFHYASPEREAQWKAPRAGYGGR